MGIVTQKDSSNNIRGHSAWFQCNRQKCLVEREREGGGVEMGRGGGRWKGG